jgi:gelsolin
MTKEYEGPSIPRNQLDSNDVFIVDTGKACYVWIGQNTSYAEKCNAFAYATNYLQSTRHPQISVTVVKEGQENAAFESAFQ